MLCRLSELVPRDCNQALSGVVRQLQRGIDEPEFVDGVMRPKRMVRSCCVQLMLTTILPACVLVFSLCGFLLLEEILVCLPETAGIGHCCQHYDHHYSCDWDHRYLLGFSLLLIVADYNYYFVVTYFALMVH